MVVVREVWQEKLEDEFDLIKIALMRSHVKDQLQLANTTVKQFQQSQSNWQQHFS
jgi:hypothetical protein